MDDFITHAQMPEAIRREASLRTLERRSRAGDFPPCVRLFRGARWSRAAVEAWLAAKAAEARLEPAQ